MCTTTIDLNALLPTTGPSLTSVVTGLAIAYFTFYAIFQYRPRRIADYIDYARDIDMLLTPHDGQELCPEAAFELDRLRCDLRDSVNVLRSTRTALDASPFPWFVENYRRVVEAEESFAKFSQRFEETSPFGIQLNYLARDADPGPQHRRPGNRHLNEAGTRCVSKMKGFLVKFFRRR